MKSNSKFSPPVGVRIGAPMTGEPHPELQWIEVASFLQIPSFQVIGLPAPEVAEARERVRAAIEASGLEFPRRRVILNLSPASIRKRGTGADLAMALAVLQEASSTSQHAGESLSMVAWGELGLDGALKATGQMTFAVYAAWEAGAALLLVAADEYGLAQERLATLRSSRLLEGREPPRILPARNLREAWMIFEGLAENGTAEKSPAWIPAVETATQGLSADRESTLMMLPRSTERLLGVATAGAHHLLLLGPRGTGKSHALEWLIALQPPPSADVRIRRALLEELSGALAGPPGQVPVRRISPQARPAALIGTASATGGVRPGEFSLAHGGLLLADEFPEWSRDSRETLREPLERGRVLLTRARRSIELPARFMLAANGNLCPCGGWPPHIPVPRDSLEGECKVSRCQCQARAIQGYLARLSGPVLDRLDLVALLTPAGPQRASALPMAEQSQRYAVRERLQALREQVRFAQARAVASWGCLPGLLDSSELERLLNEHPAWQAHLDPARFASLRTRHKIFRVALSLAAWDGHPEPITAHFAEAEVYRPERLGIG
jgi:magnesium chelatase family protein